ncbi:MAG: response regulator [Salibacteraceae bacterium]
MIIADDHLSYVQGLEYLINSDPDLEVIGLAYNGRQLLHQLKGTTPDVVLLDLRMPVMDGWEVAEQALKTQPGLKFLVLSSVEPRTFLHQLSAIGISGFLNKNSGVDEIIEGIKAVHSGATFIGKSLQASLAAELYAQNPQEDLVSDREWQILLLITREYTTHEIAHQLSLSPHTVRAHRSSLKRKLGVKNTAGLVRIALERGWV